MGTETHVIIGGTGSLGTALSKNLLDQGHKVRTFSRDEHKIERLERAIPKDQRARLSCIPGDVRDKADLTRACEGADYIINAAALKIIKTCEYAPMEAIKTNIIGSMNVIDAALACNVKRAILISTDKACLPANLYGMSKGCAEKVFTHANRYCGAKEGKFLVARYGNVWFSNGSVIKTFMEQAMSGVLQITDGECTRFHWTIDSAVNFVLDVLKNAPAGTISVPKLPAYKLSDLCHAFMRVYELGREPVVLGLRQGEKKHESMISEFESHSAKEEADRYVLHPGKTLNNGGWNFTSGTPGKRLGREELERLIRETVGYTEKGPMLYA